MEEAQGDASGKIRDILNAAAAMELDEEDLAAVGILAELPDAEIQTIDEDVSAFLANPENGANLLSKAAEDLENAEKVEKAAEEEVAAILLSFAGQPAERRSSPRLEALEAKKKEAQAAADAIAQRKKAVLDKAAFIAIRNEDQWQANQERPTFDAVQNFNLDLASLEAFASALIGSATLQKKKQEIQELELAKATARGRGPKAVKSAVAARDQYVRKLFVAQGGDECENIQGNRGSECQICGFPIEEGDSAQKPECEHVFPVAQAVFFFDLFRGGKLTDEARARFKKEYKWSHRICNQVKSSKHFLNGKGELGKRTWEVAPDKIKKYLDELWKTTHQQDATKIKTNTQTIPQKAASLQLTKEAWMRKRTDDMTTYCKAILQDFIGRCGTQQREYVLAHLSECQAFAQGQMQKVPSSPSTSAENSPRGSPAPKAPRKSSPAFKGNVKARGRTHRVKKIGKGRRTRRH